jgi:triphosphoribosyl-dephospho-CoA synthetase
MYNLDDLTFPDFYEKTVKEVRESFLEVMEFAKEFNQLSPSEVVPLIAYCVIEKEEKTFPYPLAINIKKIYAFNIGKYDAINDIKDILKKIKKISQTNLLGKAFVQEASGETIIQTRLGFLITIAQKRINLLEGKDLSAYDLALLIGLTNQGIVNSIRRAY